MENYEHDCKSFTFIWRVKNFGFCWHEANVEITSPTFSVHSIESNLWQLILYPRLIHEEKVSIACFLRLVSEDPSYLALNGNLSFLDSDGTPLQCIDILPGDLSNFVTLRVSRTEVCHKKRSEFLPQNTLTIRCKIWGVKGLIMQEGQCFAETEIIKQRYTYVWRVEGFSTLIHYDEKAEVIKFASTGFPFIAFKLWIDDKETIHIEVNPLDSDNLKSCICCFYLKGVTNKYLKCGQLEFVTRRTKSDVSWKCVLNMTKTDLLEMKESYLQNDVMSLHCDIVFATGAVLEKIERSEYGYCSCQILANSEIVIDSDSDEKHPEFSSDLKEDLKSLYEDSLFYDMNLVADTETFRVHKNVLSARSPVFKTMFTTDMREVGNNCVQIEDLNADTVRRMLMFLYSETLEDLEYESAKNLYFASDKYEIHSLKRRCSFFLENNLQLSNCCDVLCLADIHHDDDLKSSVEDFIARDIVKVIVSEEWINIEKSNPSLTATTLRRLYLRNM
ncbi:uncharacterized protein NPIL_360441 [Nephila pilipes]|uniref:Uncharacterized protein n=1 Tax=Nephila pilipes TaxID=299642 RepID=A0A8X6UP59_NEPPI|nr:uncharacterized protein NPIL_360441 [Nephila pilipes]